MRAVLLTGPPGSGKTTTLTALISDLEADDVRYAAIEVEALALVHPWPDDDAALEHLGFLSRSFERRGYPLLIVSATVADDAYAARLRAALPSNLLVVRLAADPTVLHRRITAREPPGWVGLQRLLDAAADIARVAARLPGVDLVLESDVMTVGDAVAAIRSRLAPR